MRPLAELGEATPAERHVAIVILNYNSEADLIASAKQFSAQRGVPTSIIMVDNASEPQSVERLRRWLKVWKSDSMIGTQKDVYDSVSRATETSGILPQAYLITHFENRGYSAGNNIGIRLAELLDADAVLVANPDVRVDHPFYVAELVQELFRDDACHVIASQILNSDGRSINPYYEETYFSELFWPISKLRGKIAAWMPLRPLKNNTKEKRGGRLKVSGCCFLARMSFLTENGYLDENIFLYGEEAVLAAKVEASGGKTKVNTNLIAFHEHEYGDHAANATSSLQFINSRRYYLRNYSGYGSSKLIALDLSYALMRGYLRAKRFLITRFAAERRNHV